MKADEMRIKQICEEADRLLGEEDKARYCRDPRSFPAEVQAELRRAAKKLEPILKRMADESDRDKAKSECQAA